METQAQMQKMRVERGLPEEESVMAARPSEEMGAEAGRRKMSHLVGIVLSQRETWYLGVNEEGGTVVTADVSKTPLKQTADTLGRGGKSGAIENLKHGSFPVQKLRLVEGDAGSLDLDSANHEVDIHYALPLSGARSTAGFPIADFVGLFSGEYPVLSKISNKSWSWYVLYLPDGSIANRLGIVLREPDIVPSDPRRYSEKAVLTPFLVSLTRQILAEGGDLYTEFFRGICEREDYPLLFSVLPEDVYGSNEYETGIPVLGERERVIRQVLEKRGITTKEKFETARRKDSKRKPRLHLEHPLSTEAALMELMAFGTHWEDLRRVKTERADVLARESRDFNYQKVRQLFFESYRKTEEITEKRDLISVLRGILNRRRQASEIRGEEGQGDITVVEKGNKSEQGIEAVDLEETDKQRKLGKKELARFKEAWSRNPEAGFRKMLNIESLVFSDPQDQTFKERMEELTKLFIRMDKYYKLAIIPTTVGVGGAILNVTTNNPIALGITGVAGTMSLISILIMVISKQRIDKIMTSSLQKIWENSSDEQRREITRTFG